MQQQDEEKKPFWQAPPFAAAFGDSFVEGTALEGGHIALSLMALDAALARTVPRGLCAELSVAHGLIRDCAAAAQLLASAALAQGGDDAAGKTLGAVRTALCERLSRLPPGTLALVPGGWSGKTARGSVVFVVERSSGGGGGGSGAFAVLNSGPGGIEYHSSRATGAHKHKHRTCVRVEDVPWPRLCDPALWAVLVALWTREPPSEYHRAEVLYDVVLPWLAAPRALPAALLATAADPRAAWRTVRRSETSAWGSVVEALAYVLRHLGTAEDTIRRVLFAVRREMLLMALDDLGAFLPSPATAQQAEAAARLGVALAPCSNPPEKRREFARIDVWLLQTACKQLAACAVKENEKGRLADAALLEMRELAELGCALAECVPVTVAGSGDQRLLVAPNAELYAPAFPFRGFGTLLETDVSKYVGAAASPAGPGTADLLSVPPRTENLAQSIAAIVQCDGIVAELMHRCGESSTASRVALQYMAIELITTLFTEVLPLPLPLDAPPEQCPWRSGAITPEVQLMCLERLHRLALSYATMWQAVERPTRAFDSERSLVAGCMLAAFDSIARMRSVTGASLHLSELLWEDGGYAPSTGVCMNNRPFEEISNAMELVSPTLVRARDGLLAYFSSLERTCHNAIFELRQPDKLEVRKHSATMQFLRRMVARCGYKLIPQNVPVPPTEMEALCHWLTSERTELAGDHPEFGQLRDMAFLFKYLATMETREAELLRKRRPTRQFQHWRLSFDDESGGRYGFATWDSVAAPLRWEILGFRGADMNIADLHVLAFGNRELSFGEGPVLRSPSDLTLLAPDVGESPTEDDVIHATVLPTFGGTLSRDESEALLSYLTVPYARVPLVLNFFATHDRATYLYDQRLYALLRSAMLEPGPWVPEALRVQAELIPSRRSALQKREHEMERLMDARIQPDAPVLATPHGLLLNELRMSPESTLGPLVAIVTGAVNDLRDASVRSPDAPFILSLFLLAVDTDVFVLNVLDEKPSIASEAAVAALELYHARIGGFLRGLAAQILARWTEEAEAEGDIPTACVVHAYRALLWSGLRSNELDAKAVQALFASIAYVRNWHGFGMGQNRSDLLWDEDSDAEQQGGQPKLDANARLLRFMQAQGIDTTRIRGGELDKFLSNPGKALFLHVGNETLRCPRLLTSAGNGQQEQQDKLPPADVPEARLFWLLQKHRRPLVAWFEAAPQAEVDTVTTLSIKVALRDAGFTYAGWRRIGRGRLYAEKAEITVDLQSAEIAWRNSELRPVPDSMTQYADFAALFGSEALHCGVVSRTEHRNWVHIVGTEYDLQEWDRPSPADQGVCAPAPAPLPAPPSAAQGGDAEMLQICMRCGEIGKCWSCPQCTFVNCGAANTDAPCSMCGFERPGRRARTRQGSRPEPMQPVANDRALFEGVVFCRQLDPYGEDPHPVASEKWVADILRRVVPALYPPMPPNMKLGYPLLLPEAPLPDGANEARLIGCDAADKPEATWKEWVVRRIGNDSVVQIFNLVSHARRIYRSLVFTTDTANTLHGHEPLAVSQPNTVLPPQLLHAAGDPRTRRPHGGSLAIVRRNVKLGGQETYVPPRLLQGLIPSALLEAFRFWQGEDLVLRGSPVGEESAGGSPWFAYKVEVTISRDERVARIIRKPLNQAFSRIRTEKPLPAASSLLRHSSSRVPLVREAEAEEEALLAQLLPLGHSREACKLAVRKAGRDAGAAASWLLDEANFPELLLADMAHVSAADPQQALVNEGFKPNSSRYALNLCGGNQDTARAWLLDDSNRAQIDRLDHQPEQMEDEEASSSAAEAMQVDDDGEEEAPSDGRGSFVLLNLVDAPEGSFLWRLAALLTRIEDLSHALVWGIIPQPSVEQQQQQQQQQQCEVLVVELPRLKIKLQPQRDDEDGSVRLALLDHAGWFVSTEYGVARSGESSIPPAGAAFVEELLRGIPHGIVLQNSARELRVLVPNHDLYRPRVTGDPFSGGLVCDRGSAAWQQAMDVRFFLFPVHTSRTFITGLTLAARLYLLLMRLLTRQYRAAFSIAESCYVDTIFAPDENRVFQQLEKTLGDRHPDALACRLKTTLAVAYSDNKTPWDLLPELDSYLRKLSHVSLSCKLLPDEELDLLRASPSATPRVRARLEYMVASATNKPSVVLSPGRVRNGGDPWERLTCLGGQFIDSHASHLTRLQYQRPKPGSLDEVGCFGLIWDSSVLGDDLSGCNRGLGFLFLYDALRGKQRMTLLGADCTRTICELLTHWLHLKLSRWGKEQQEEGETEVALPAEFSVLAAMLRTDPAIAEAAWPAIPEDGMTARMLNEGVELYSKESRGTALKSFVDDINAQLKQLLLSASYDEVVAEARNARAGVTLQAAREFSQTGTIQVVAARAERPSVSDTSCSSLSLHAGSFSSADFASFSEMPLATIGLEKYLVLEPGDETTNASRVQDKMPFSVAWHPAAAATVAQDMLRRIGADVSEYAEMVRARSVPRVRMLTPREVAELVHSPTPQALHAVVEMLDTLVRELQALQEQDSRAVDETARRVLELSNRVDTASSHQDIIARTRFVMRRMANREAEIDLELATSALLSTTAARDLVRVNHFLESAPSLIDALSGAMLRVSRVSQANRAVSLALALKALLRRLAVGGAAAPSPTPSTSAASSTAATLDRIGHAASSLADTLACRRFFVLPADAGNKRCDPRFLLFEYIFDIMLRERQVKIVEEFMERMHTGESHVQQMIMGAGKTTVVGPLLTLMLADGKSLVVQVMPTALLEQTRNILRNCFSTVVKKRIFTLQFDRSVEDRPEAIAVSYAKLEGARACKGVVCAAPEAIKSLMLKLVEELHSLEGFDPAAFSASRWQSDRGARAAARLRDTMAARGDAADELARVLELWRSGVLIMDEVDVLLHPLRSELNYPIGDKLAIDLSGHRWDMPIHLLSAIFWHELRGPFETSFDHAHELEEAGRWCGINPRQVLQALSDAIAAGYVMHSLQHSPHLVLLDEGYYRTAMRPLAARWLLLWLRACGFSGAVDASPATLLEYLEGIRVEEHRQEIETGLMPESRKLLNLGASWIRSLLPHVLSKINRVSYGLLSPADLAGADPRQPLSRLLMAVPFVGKDVPSRSSEFAHPDAAIGLAILAFRYEGMRRSDVRRLVAQLKQDFSRQVGPRDQRPSSTLFAHWLRLAGGEGSGVLPLALFQPADDVQLSRLHGLLTRVPEVVHYYLRQHVFPACMTFQRLKVSACGYDLGSEMLFGRRVGFSGTPSNLLPLDLGECRYEPGSDGRVLAVLTSPAVVTARPAPEGWNAKQLLLEACAAEDPPYHTLIDTGALVTGMENEEVAQFLLAHLPAWAEGVVYLDRLDRQMVLLRSGRAVLLAQCGVAPERRFTFYDQVHTTGMDIRQSSSAVALLTIGKDMTFRDYAQGAYRMRGIGVGMRVHLYLTPEVRARISAELGDHCTGRPELDVPAWLLVNSMRAEGLQFLKMRQQELTGTWRKRALASLVHAAHGSLPWLQRFSESPLLRRCVNAFREAVGFSVCDHVPEPGRFAERLRELVRDNAELVSDDATATARVRSVAAELSSAAESLPRQQLRRSAAADEEGLDTEIVHEQEAEEQAEEEAEEEEQKASAFSRDDEQHEPWPAKALGSEPPGEPFYRASSLKEAWPGQKALMFPEQLHISDNFFKPRWCGLGPRRLRRVALALEWVPCASKALLRWRVPAIFRQLAKTNPEMSPSTAAAEALRIAMASVSQADVAKTLGLGVATDADAAASSSPAPRFVSAVTLAEAETLRRCVHKGHPVFAQAAVALRSLDGNVVDRSPNWFPAPDGSQSLLLSLRFLNGEMYYSDSELLALDVALAGSGLSDRIAFFEGCQQLRRGEKHLWADTPIARLFSPKEEWGALGGRAAVAHAREALRRAIGQRGVDPYTAFSVADVDGDGALTHEELQRLLESFRLGFSPGDCREIARTADTAGVGRVSLEQFRTALALPPQEVVSATLREVAVRRQLRSALKGVAAANAGRWQCPNCTFINAAGDSTCAVCECGWSGRRECPKDKWACSGCTFFNPKTLFYCAMCERARPDLAHLRLI